MAEHQLTREDFIFAMEAAGFETPESNKSRDAFLYQRDQDRWVGWCLACDTIPAAALASPPVAVQEEGDAARFDWFFGPADKIAFMPTYMEGMRKGWTAQQWRSAIDAAMKGDKP